MMKGTRTAVTMRKMIIKVLVIMTMAEAITADRNL